MDPQATVNYTTAEINEFTNTARDIFKFVMNYHPTISRRPVMLTGAGQPIESPEHQFHDVINYFLNTIPLFLEEVRKNNQSRSTSTTNPISHATSTDHTPCSSIIEEFSSPVANIANIYTRSMLKCLVGYPLYDPKPDSKISNGHPYNGVNVGDVGFVRGDGTFDFLFNICPLNQPNPPDGFSLSTADDSAARSMEPLAHNTCLFSTPITKTKSGEYICEGCEGAVLELPEGAVQDEVTNTRPFAMLASRHGVQWYEYTMAQGREISNGSLYLVTSVTKCAHWGIAVFDRPCAQGQGLRFDEEKSLQFGKSTSRYRWRGSSTFPSKASKPNHGDAPNQCIFLRGYKIMIRQDIFDNLCNGTNLLSTKSDEEVVIYPNFDSSLVHPSDLINAGLLSQNHNSKVALTHDDVWCNLLRDNFPNFNYETLINITRSYMNTVNEYDCVYLEKIHSSSNALDDSNRPIQGNETPTIREPLTTLDDSYPPVLATVTLILPHELVERILLLLDPKSVLTCRLVNKEFNDIIQSSTLLQYFLACEAAGVIDNFQSPLVHAERLKALKKWEDAWRNLKPVFETTIGIIDQPSTLFEFTAGNYFLTDNDRKYLYYCPLPSSAGDNPKWSMIPGHGPGQDRSGFIVDMCMAIYEHDLIVNVISSEVGNAAEYGHSLDLVLLEFSSGKYHPLARHPRIHIQRSSSAPSYVLPRVVGNNLALIVGSENIFQDRLFIFDWKTGHKRLQHEATDEAYSYSSLVFISPELLLIPNIALFHFEIWHLPPSDTNTNPPVLILFLQIPAISRYYTVNLIRCHGDVNPFLHSMPYFPSRPFFPSPEDSIIIINFSFTFYRTIRNGRAYSLVMNRHALLDTIRKWTSSPHLEHLPRWTNEVTVHEVADPDDGSVKLVAKSEFLHDMSGTSPQIRDSHPTFPTSYSFFEPGSSSSISSGSYTSSKFQYDIPCIRWADWGPPISRWFQIGDNYAWCINQSTGQRYAFMCPNPLDWTKRLVHVADFNPYNVRRNAEMMAQVRKEDGDDSGTGSNEERKKGDEELELLDDEGIVFSEEVYMGLKCVIYHTPDEYDFDAVFMNEEIVLGLKLDLENRVEEMKVLYIG